MSEINDYIHRASHSNIFFIVDDGSHRPEHQVNSFNYFFSELLLMGGTYIIEDIETSYWRVGYAHIGEFRYGYKHANSAIEIFKHLADDINYEFLSDEDREKQDSLLEKVFSLKTRNFVSSVTFGHNCIIIVKKSVEEVVVYNDRVYRGRAWPLFSPTDATTTTTTTTDYNRNLTPD
jgi:hypothetical protein